MNTDSRFTDNLWNRSIPFSTIIARNDFTCCTTATITRIRESLESHTIVTIVLLFLSRLTHYLFISAAQGVCIRSLVPSLSPEVPLLCCIFFLSTTFHLILLSQNCLADSTQNWERVKQHWSSEQNQLTAWLQRWSKDCGLVESVDCFCIDSI